MKIKKAKFGGGSKKGRQQEHRRGRYASQAIRTARNKLRAWKRHLAKFPNDKQAQQKLPALIALA